MIGGYILPSRNSHFENVFRKSSTTPLQELVVESRDYIGWFFHTFDEQRSRNNVYSHNGNLLMIDGIAVTGNPVDGYRLLEPLKDFSEAHQTDFQQLLDKMVSNVNVILVNRSDNGFIVKFASHRASGGRIWYTQIPNSQGLILCDDFRLLLKLSRFEIEPKAIYAILKYGASPCPVTIIKNIYSVPVSHFATYTTSDSDIRTQPFFQFDFPEASNCDIKPIEDILHKSVQFLGSLNALLLLSGGVDSTLLAHYLNSENAPQAFFLSFGKSDPELTFAKEAAKKAGVILNTFHMEAEDVVSAIKGAASSYMHPFNDYSTIPTYYLMNRIENIYPNGSIVIDGNGAEPCFGFPVLAMSLLWKLLYAQPRFIKQIERSLYDRGGMYKRASKLGSLFSMMAMTCERDIQLGPLVRSPMESFFTEQLRGCAQEVSSLFLKTFSSCTGTGAHNNSFRSRATVAEILHSCRWMTLKTFRVGAGKEPPIDVVYPFLWKDMLVEQGNLSWDCKVRDGILKWPIKKLLEEHMPPEFIYRKKSTFTPPLLNWLLQEDVYDFIRDVLLNPHAFIHDLVSVKKVQKLIDRLPMYGRAPGAVLNFLWGVLFIELWLEENYKHD